MKKRLTENLSLKIMSVIVGFLVWLIVVNVDNPTVTSSFTIPLSNIEVLNEAYVDSTGMMCMLDDSQNGIRVHVTGERKTVRKLSNSDFHAAADLQQAVSLDTDPVMIPITVTCPGISAANIEINPKNLKVHLREKKTQEFVVSVTSGESKPGKGYEIGKLTANPEKIKITGPSSLISKIGSVTASVNLDGITGDVVEETELRFSDKNGDPLSESQMNYLNAVRTVSVSAELWKVRSNIRINADYSGFPANGYRVYDITTVPDVLSLAGNKEGLLELESLGNQISIPADCLDITDATGDTEMKINILEYLPENTRLTTGSSEDVWVRAMILPIGSSSYDLPTKNVTVRNLKKDLQVSFDLEKIEIRVQEDTGDLDNFDISDVTAYIDLKNMEEGFYEVPVQVELPEGLSLVDNVVTEIKITAVSVLEDEQN
ncbi:MAG: hypothetical protein KBT01_06845 [Clostridiales bacterium]|nr:hypothetical protein [Candidatus Blautia equi]